MLLSATRIENAFDLLGSDEMSREIEGQRRAQTERAEAERRVAQELEIAKQVQARLFPQTFPGMRTLDYAGACIQVRHVGGDYYDFFALGEERLGLFVGDISGKGIAAALLMANLQANLRSQFALAREQPQRFLQSVNRLFFENTVDSAYATVFFAEYDDASRRLRYTNCGHLSALLLRRNGRVEWLHSTGTVLGSVARTGRAGGGVPAVPRRHACALHRWSDRIIQRGRRGVWRSTPGRCFEAASRSGGAVGGCVGHRGGTALQPSGAARRHYVDRRQVPRERVGTFFIGAFLKRAVTDR